MNNTSIQLIFGLKLRELRHKRGLSLQKFSELVGLSASYLNEIENGKKHPKPEKIMQIAQALGVEYDQLVSEHLSKDLHYIEAFLNSPGMRKFPFHLFGITRHDVLALIPNAPREGQALLKAMADTARAYDMSIDDFLHTALRCYQEMHHNYFEDIEEAVEGFRKDVGWKQDQILDYQAIYGALVDRFGYEIDEQSLPRNKHLSQLRSIRVEGAQPRLLINGKLSPLQRGFMAAREIGCLVMNLKVRWRSSPDIEVESFDQVLSAFQASYFASALFMSHLRMRDQLTDFFSRNRFDDKAFLKMIDSFGVTPEMFFYRMSEILPRFFQINEIHFLRLDRKGKHGANRLIKQLNTSKVKIPTGVALNESFCARWLSVRIIDEFLEAAHAEAEHIARAQLSKFVGEDDRFFCICVARRLRLESNTTSSITIGFRVTRSLRKVIPFLENSQIPEVTIGETCERCSLTKDECSARSAQPVVYEGLQRRERQKEELLRVVDGE